MYYTRPRNERQSPIHYSSVSDRERYHCRKRSTRTFKGNTFSPERGARRPRLSTSHSPQIHERRVVSHAGHLRQLRSRRHGSYFSSSPRFNLRRRSMSPFNGQQGPRVQLRQKIPEYQRKQTKDEDRNYHKSGDKNLLRKHSRLDSDNLRMSGKPKVETRPTFKTATSDQISETKR